MCLPTSLWCFSEQKEMEGALGEGFQRSTSPAATIWWIACTLLKKGLVLLACLLRMSSATSAATGGNESWPYLGEWKLPERLCDPESAATSLHAEWQMKELVCHIPKSRNLRVHRIDSLSQTVYFSILRYWALLISSRSDFFMLMTITRSLQDWKRSLWCSTKWGTDSPTTSQSYK